MLKKEYFFKYLNTFAITYFLLRKIQVDSQICYFQTSQGKVREISIMNIHFSSYAEL